jgi:cytochrome c oxidase cbb3-type subunit 2
MAGNIYSKPVLFTIVSAIVILIGTAVTMFIPMLTPQMHPRLENLKPFTPLQLAGRDIYQREGCNNCHTQTVRPLKTEVMRYGEYSKAGEFYYDRPFLWGSKRTGPDLARIGGKYPDAWHYRHFEDPRSLFPQSNMPSYGWLKERLIDPEEVRRHMDVLNLPYTEEEIENLRGKTEMDALIAYIQSIGTAVKRRPVVKKAVVREVELKNPLAGDPRAIARGRDIFMEHCAMCHGDDAKGDIGPSLVDDVFFYVEGDLPDDDYFEVINNGTFEGMVEEGRTAKGGMPPFGEELGKDEIWSVISYIRSLKEEGR